MKTILLTLFISILLLQARSNAFVLSPADTLGLNKMAIAGIYSTNKVTTYVPGVITADLANYAHGIVFQYGILQNLDIMAGIGTIGYQVTPDIAGVLKMEGGLLMGTGFKYGILKEDKDIPVSLGFLFQYNVVPADLTEAGVKSKGWDYDTYYKMIVSKKLHEALYPYIAFGINSRVLNVGTKRSNSNIAQIDLGYITAVTHDMIAVVELNWSAGWHDAVMDDVFASTTRSEAIGYSFGIVYLY
jgi:hypothetical protein